ncbi:MAG: hypothetical protein IJ083_12655 [Clostridia bacterium]|nr:hypothetical protein [Clostridia bacterium]
MKFQARESIKEDFGWRHPYVMVDDQTGEELEDKVITLLSYGGGKTMELASAPDWDTEEGESIYRDFIAFLRDEGKAEALTVTRLEDLGAYLRFLEHIGFEEINHDLSGWYPTIDMGLVLK